MKRKAVLFVDADDGEIPVYTYREPHFKEAKALGFSCLAVAVKSRKNTEHLVDDSDEVFFLDEITVDSLLRLISKAKKQYDIAAVFCHAGHASSGGEIGCVVAGVCRELQLVYSSPEAIAACNNKFLMRHKLKLHGVKSISYALCHDIDGVINHAEHIGYPLIFKPPFGAGSAFIKKCDNQVELLNHYLLFVEKYNQSNMSDFYNIEHDIILDNEFIAHYIPGKSILLEDYIEGIEGTVECVIHNGMVYPLLINEKLMLTERSGTILENLLICPAVSFSEEEADKIKKYSVECIQALGLYNDIVHLEFKLSKNEPIVIEINPRLGGLYVDNAFQDIAGINPYKLYLSMLLQEDKVDALVCKGIDKIKHNVDQFSMMVIYPEVNGFFNGFDGINYIKNNPLFCKYDECLAGSYINADIEENYLLKCWVSVNDKEHAYDVYKKLLSKVTPVITKKKPKELECI